MSLPAWQCKKNACCCVLQCAAMCCSVLQGATVCCSVLQCAAVCCSVLQCVEVCCSVLQCVAPRKIGGSVRAQRRKRGGWVGKGVGVKVDVPQQGQLCERLMIFHFSKVSYECMYVCIQTTMHVYMYMYMYRKCMCIKTSYRHIMYVCNTLHHTTYMYTYMHMYVYRHVIHRYTYT